MRTRRSVKFFMATILLAAPVSSASLVALGQQSGTAAKGGSTARGRLDSPRVPNRKNQPALYRPVIRVLGFNLSELEEIYLTTQRQNPQLEFETLIKAFIVAEKRSPDSLEETGRKLVDSLGAARNKLSRALQHVYAMTEEEAKEAERAANLRYRQAEREAARPTQ